MKMKRNLLFVAMAVVGLAACNNFKKGDGDLMYSIHKSKGGEKIKEGDFVLLNAIQKTEEDSVMVNTYDFQFPAFFKVQKSAFKGDLFDAMKLLSEGDSATFKINIDSMAAKMGQPKPANTKGKYFVFNVKIDKVIPKGNLADSVQNKKINDFLKGEFDKAKTGEAAKIKAYIASKKLDVKTTASGLNYVISTPGDANKPALGDTVEVKYTGRLSNDHIFDTSDKEEAKKAKLFDARNPYKPVKLVLGQVIRGWNEGLTLIGKGGKIKLVVPSTLGYGEQGMRPIPPFAPLVFDIELIDVKKGKGMPAPPAPVAPVTAAPTAKK